METPARDAHPTDHADRHETLVPTPDTVRELRELGETIEGDPTPDAEVPVILLLGMTEFDRAAVDYGLLAEGELEAFVTSQPDETRPTSAVGLARALVSAGRLTRYQASALLQGKAKVLAIGPYVILDRLGSGGMGLVFRARHRESDDLVALKLLPPSASKQDQLVSRFRREARIMAQLDHPNLVSSRAIGEYGGLHYLVMDYVEGNNLHRFIQYEGPLGLSRAVDFICQAARGLSAAHERGIVHRDIKPANLMLDLEGTVRVLDLGLARITRTDAWMEGNDPDPSLTHSGTIMGTVDFLSPEQSNNSKMADHRSDIYSLGCTLHYLLIGSTPYSGTTLMERLIAHHQQPVPSLRALRPEVPESLDVVFARMLAKDPELRPQSMIEVISLLQASIGIRQSRGGVTERGTHASPGQGSSSEETSSRQLGESSYEILASSTTTSPSGSRPDRRKDPARPRDVTEKKRTRVDVSEVNPSVVRWWVSTAILVMIGLVVGTGLLLLALLAKAVVKVSS
jgi:serine/threonine protein kinase